MKLPFKERSLSTLVVVPSAIVVAVLAVMQYRWSTGVSEATAVRLADSLQMSLVNWQIDFYRYFSNITLAMSVDPSDTVSTPTKFANWQRVAKYPDLIAKVSTLRSDASPWPETFEPLRAALNSAPDSKWLFEPSLPALFQHLPSGDWMAVELNLDVIRTKIFDDLSHTYFQGTNGLDYLVAVVSWGGSVPVLYSSDSGFGSPEPVDSDGAIDLFARAHPTTSVSPVRVFHAPSQDKGPSSSMRLSWFPFLRDTSTGSDWRVIVRHRRGGALGAFVAEMRRRDLAIGFGLVLVLVINMGMLIVTSHRAHRLAQLQMNFVTAVSHELRTPLTVIISGADNICNGVVQNTPQLQQYGALIGKQARQLFGLVERILMFAATRQGQQRYNLRELQITELIEAALASTEGLIAAGQFKVEQTIAPNLPPVLGDSSALSQCLQNLITNGLKYGKEQRWLGISAEVRDGEVQISISDRGIGISPSELSQIFEPFYRSPSVRAAQIPGTGLGLPLSQSIAEAMKGRLTVSSTLGQGSTFTLHLPSLRETSAAA